MSLATSSLLDSNQHRKHYIYKNYALVQFILTTVDITINIDVTLSRIHNMCSSFTQDVLLSCS